MYVDSITLISHDELERRFDSLEAMTHPRCVGWGEIGLDYHYDNSPRDVQQVVFTRQLKHAVKLGKPLTIHTREAEDDTERILKSEVPSEHKVGHPHVFFYAHLFIQSSTSSDSCSLLHRLARISAKVVEPFPKPSHRNHRYAITKSKTISSPSVS
jgi:Tat protein secretion system quality control protein TatD with DNase activity